MKLFHCKKLAFLVHLVCALFISVHPTLAKEFRPLGLESMDTSLFPASFVGLGMERLMHPIDMADWPLKITRDRQLFVDDYLLAASEGVTRQLHQPTPHPGNPVMRMFEYPWVAEDGFSVIILRDEETGQFRMWYNTKLMFEAENGIRYRGPTCYATSDDGLHWTKPALGTVRIGSGPFRHSWRGELKYPNPAFVKSVPDDHRNIVLAEGSIVGLFHEPDDPDPSRRYKAMAWHDPRGQAGYAPREGLYLYFSPDGIHWEKNDHMCEIPERVGITTKISGELVPSIGDTSNFIWDPKLNKYICNAKILFRRPTLRTIAHTESDDLIHWTRPIVTMNRDRFDGTDQIGEITRIPYESMWIGLLGVYHWPEGMWKQKHLQLAASRDGHNWHRVNRGEAFLPIGGEGVWDTVFSIAGRLGPLLIGDELWFYYMGIRRMERYESEGIDMPHIQHVGRAKLRRDGFVSLDAGSQPGDVTIRPLSFEGSELYVNAEVEEGGYVKVGLLTRNNKPIESFTLNDAQATVGDNTKAKVSWKNTPKMDLLPGDHVRFEFEMKNAHLYAFWVE